MLRRGILAVLVVGMASCVPAEMPPTTIAAAPTTTSTLPPPRVTTSTPPPPRVTTSTLPPPRVNTSTTRIPEAADPQPIPPCLTPEPPFGNEGQIGSYYPTGSDSALLATIDWQPWAECERFVFSLASPEGAPTLVPPTAVLISFAERGVIRLQMGPEVNTSAVAYQLVNTRLVDRLYVVKSPDGGLIVDLHLAEPAAARVIPRSAPATLTVDLRPGGASFFHQPIITSQAVLFLPSGREAIHYPFTVNGYLRPGTEEPVATLTGADGTVTEARFPLAGVDDVWSSFVAVFPEGPSGWATLQVEDAQARVLFEN